MVIFHSYVSFYLVNPIPMTDPFSVLPKKCVPWIPSIYPSHVSIFLPAPARSVMGLGHPKIWHTKFVDDVLDVWVMTIQSPIWTNWTKVEIFQKKLTPCFNMGK